MLKDMADSKRSRHSISSQAMSPAEVLSPCMKAS